MKKQSLIAAVAAGAMLLSACSSAASPSSALANASEQSTTETISIVATTFPEYDWVRQIIGEGQTPFTLTLLSDTGVDLHSFEPSVEDIATIASADLFIYNGGESDTWVHDVLASPENADLTSLSILESLSDLVIPAVTTEGMQVDEDAHAEHEHAEEDEHAHEEEHDHAEGEEDVHVHDHPDEHVWLSLTNAIVLTETLAAELATLDPANAELYTANAGEYAQQLSDLDAQYTAMVEGAPYDTVLFADRFPFLYLMRDYGISYYAAFDGCSAETEASFETVAFLTQKTDELNTGYVLITDGGNAALAATVINGSQNAEREVLTLDSMQSVTAEDVAGGATYLSIMQSNLEVLATALGN